MARDLYDLIQASYVTNILFEMTKNDIFDLLALKPMSAAELARTANLDEDVLLDILDMAVAIDFLRYDGSRYWVRRSGLLLTKASKSWLRDYLLVWGYQLNPVFSKFDEFLKQGAPPFKAFHGDNLWQKYNKEPYQNDIFLGFMNGVTNKAHMPLLVDEFRIAAGSAVVDVAGGGGALVCNVLSKRSDLTGVIYDQPSNIDLAQSNISNFGIADRCKFVGGSIFDSVPGGADVYLLKHVMHDWNDENALKILESISRAMSKDAIFILVEGVLDTKEYDKNFPEYIHTRNVEQRIWTEGKLRRLAAHEALLNKAGLKIYDVSHTKICDASLIYSRR